MKKILKNGRLISPDFSSDEIWDIFIEDGKIKEIGKNFDTAGADVYDAGGNYIFPGLIDMHCNICDPGYEHMEDIESASLSAAKGGFTTIACEPNTKPAIDNKTVVEYIVSKSREYSLVNILPYGSMSIGCEGKYISEIGEMKQAGIIGISDGDVSIHDTNLLRNIFRYAMMFDLPVLTHCEDKKLSADGVMNEGEISTCLGLKGIPREAEEIEVARNIVLAECVGNHLHISHVSTKGSVQLIREAKKRGVKVTCETCPHYFTLTEKMVEDYNTFAKVNPPLRTKEDVEAVIEGLVDGTIDVIASGHSPTKLEYKNTEFRRASYGLSSFETTFAISYSVLVKDGILSAMELSQKMSKNPAKILGLEKKGCIAIGYDADLTVVNLTDPYTIDPFNFFSKAKFSLYEGKTVYGNVECSVVGGRFVF